MQSNPLGRLFAALVLTLVCTTAWTGVLAADLGTGRLVVAPINLGVDPTEALSPGLNPVWLEILGHLQDTEGNRPIAALERESAEALWRSVKTEAQVLDPQAGIHDVYARFAKALAEEYDYGVLIFPVLITRAARVSGDVASWDGVEHGVWLPRIDDSVYAGRGGSLSITSQGGTGELAAASLHVAIFEPGGELRYEGTGGLTLLQEVVQSDGRSKNALETRFRSKPFGDVALLRKGISAALRESGASLPAAPASAPAEDPAL